MYDDTLDAGVPYDMAGDRDEDREEALYVPAVPGLLSPGTASADGGEMDRLRECKGCRMGRYNGASVAERRSKSEMYEGEE